MATDKKSLWEFNCLTAVIFTKITATHERGKVLCMTIKSLAELLAFLYCVSIVNKPEAIAACNFHSFCLTN